MGEQLAVRAEKKHSFAPLRRKVMVDHKDDEGLRKRFGRRRECFFYVLLAVDLITEQTPDVLRRLADD
jgi:hypothetical protein